MCMYRFHNLLQKLYLLQLNYTNYSFKKFAMVAVKGNSYRIHFGGMSMVWGIKPYGMVWYGMVWGIKP